MRTIFRNVGLVAAFLLFGTNIFAQQRIVSLNGTMSEILCALGLEEQIVGVDVTSNYPAVLNSKTKVGYNRTVSAEGILSLRPTLIIGADNEVPAQVISQLKNAKVNMFIGHQEYSVEGTKQLIVALGKATNTEEKAKQVVKDFQQRIDQLTIKPNQKKVLFIYARGAGAMSVAGKNTALHNMIVLAGAKNAIEQIDGFQPLTTEALVAANPDAILLFDSGLNSMGGNKGLLEVPGIKMTNAGKKGKVITMDGQLLSGFGLRLPEAIQSLYQKIIE
ncbi:heme/hemin ABC transporter substrate-binding protein [Gynurincola endophyticus]|uniref:heme/hemin ABC transporter substrate-binding protein n=1 Tax=Gynurincola endophyticus TaxID=2479004 RepID=UPI000F8EA1A8|nr:ABC transporter substrate-binding protein [Gynurincola endophyticus]